MKKIKRKLTILTMAFVMLFTSLQVYAEDAFTNYYICGNSGMRFYTLNGKDAKIFKELVDTTVETRKATSEEINTVKGILHKQIKEADDKLIKGGLNPEFLKNREYPINEDKYNYYIVKANDKLYLAEISKTNKGFVDLTKEEMPVKVKSKHEKQTLSGSDAEAIYNDCMAYLVKGRYLGDRLYKEINSFSTNKESEKERFKDALDKYLSLGITYDIHEEAEDQFKSLEEGKGMCWSMSILFSKFLDKANIPYRYIHKQIYRDGKLNPISHLYLQVFLDGKWIDFETTVATANKKSSQIIERKAGVIDDDVFTNIPLVYSNQEYTDKIVYTSSYTYKNGQVVDPKIEKITIYY